MWEEAKTMCIFSECFQCTELLYQMPLELPPIPTGVVLEILDKLSVLIPFDLLSLARLNN